MTTEKPTNSSTKFQLFLIFTLFAVPLALAAIMYYGGGLVAPRNTTNYGELLQPIVNLRNALPHSPLHSAAGRHWALIYANAGACDSACADDLVRLRQIRRMLGHEMDRVARVFLHGESAPDKVLLQEQHAGIITITDNALAELLEGKIPDDIYPGGLYLVDPLANLVLYFPRELNPRDVVADIEHLLELSRIG